MAYVWQATIVDASGDVQVGASIEVRREDSGALAALYSDVDGDNALENPLTADSDGFARFYVDSGVFRIVATAGDFSRTWRHVPIGLSQSIIGGLLYPQTAEESAASVTPTNYAYPPGYVNRYGDLNDASFAAALSTNRSVYLVAGETLVLAQTHAIPASTDIVVTGAGIATIDASAVVMSGGPILSCQGSVSAPLGGGLAASVAAGDITLQFTAAPAVSPGDLILLRDPTNASWNADNPSYRKGEFLIVKAVSGNQIVLASAVLDSYSDATAYAARVEPTTTSFLGKLRIIGNPDDTINLPTVYFKYGRHNRVHDVSFVDTAASCLIMSTCYAPNVQRVDTGKLTTDAGLVQSTGVILAGCQYGHVRDSVLIGARHGASTGGGGEAVDRFNVFQGNFIASRQGAAADFHGSAEFCSYIDNHIDGAVNLSGARNRLIGNHIYPHAVMTTLINFDAAKSIDHLIEGNTLHLRGPTVVYALDANADTDINASTVDDGTLVIRNNAVIDTRERSSAYFFVRNNGSASRMEIAVTGNDLRKTNADYFGNALSVSVVSGSQFARIIYENNKHEGAGFGIVSGVDEIRVAGSLGVGTPSSSSPSFGTARFEPSEFYFEKLISLASPSTSFVVFGIPTGCSFLPTMAAARTNTAITATNGDYMSIGVNANDRRADFGVSSVAASGGQHAKNAKIRFVNGPQAANQPVTAAEAISLMSVNGVGDSAALANNIGGAGQSITVRMAGYMIGDLPDAA